MNKKSTNKQSATDWKRIDALTDEQIDTSDIPPLTERFFQRARLRMPTKKIALTIHVDADVLNWYQAQGEDIEQRMNAALRIYAEAH